MRNKIEDIAFEVEESIFDRIVQPETIFHNTNASGFQGIIDSTSLRMTHAAYLNDSSELVYAQNIAEKCLDDHFTEENIDDISLKERIVAELRAMAAHLTTAVTCFSLEGNLLNQWRDYGGQQAYCLEIKFPQVLTESKVVARIYPVVYDEGHQIELAKSYLNKVTELYRSVDFQQALKEATEIDKNYTLIATAYGLSRICAFFKHSSFSVEKEFRMVWQGIPSSFDWEYAPSMYGLTPFFLRKFEGKLPLKAVMIGLCRFPLHALHSARGFLLKNEYFVDVNTSYIPMRF